MQRILAQAVRSAKKKAIAASAVGVGSGAGAAGRASGVKEESAAAFEHGWFDHG